MAMNNFQEHEEEEEEEEEEEVARLSFSNFPLEDTNSGGPKPSSDRPDPFFEFSTSQMAPPTNPNDVVFCGKIIRTDGDLPLNEYQKRDYFANGKKSQSLRNPDGLRPTAASSRFSTSDMNFHRSRSVNITSLTSMSAKSRRRMFMFGPVKFKPEMEIGDIKRRQARMIPLPEKGASQLEVVQPTLRGRSCLVGRLVRSIGCIPGADTAAAAETQVGMVN